MLFRGKVLKGIVEELGALGVRVDALEADNQFLRFELTQTQRALSQSLSQGSSARRLMLLSEMGVESSSSSAEAAHPPYEPLDERMDALEEAVSALRSHANQVAALPSSSEGALLFTKCLSCQKTSLPNGRDSPPPDGRAAPHGRPMKDKIVLGRASSATGGSTFRLEAERRLGASGGAIQQEQLAKLIGQGTSEAPVSVHVGRRSGSFGVEKLRPRSATKRFSSPHRS